MSFTFTCTFLEPTGEIKIGDTSKTYDYVTEDSSYTFTVPVADLTEEDGTVVPSFTIPVQWRTGAYTAGELQEEISLEVAFAQLPAGYTGTVATTGVITGAIDHKQIASTRGIAEMFVGGFADWKEEFGNDPLGLVWAEAQADYAMDHITLPANTVYAKIPADTGYTVVHEYYTSTNGGAFELTGTVRTQAEGEEGDPLSGTNIREDKVVDLYYTAEGEDIPDPEVPEGELPTDPTDPTQPGGGTDLEDPDVPTAEVPETGDASLIWAAVALLSGIGLAWLVISGKKREENA